MPTLRDPAEPTTYNLYRLYMPPRVSVDAYIDVGRSVYAFVVAPHIHFVCFSTGKRVIEAHALVKKSIERKF